MHVYQLLPHDFDIIFSFFHTKQIPMKAYKINNPNGVYFLTIQVLGWVDIFSRKKCCNIIIASMNYCRTHKHLELHAYVIMSNHIHLIVSSNNECLAETIRDFKRFTARQILEFIYTNPSESRSQWMKIVFEYYARGYKRGLRRKFWTDHNHAVELISNRMIDSCMEYIHQNPVKAGIVRAAEDYIYSSASNYADIDSIIEIDFI